MLFLIFFRYDIDNSGAIDKGEMVNVMSKIYSMVDGNVKVGDIISWFLIMSKYFYTGRYERRDRGKGN